MKQHCRLGVRWSVAAFSMGLAKAAVAGTSNPATPSIFDPVSTPAHDIYHLSLFVMAICLGIFLVVFSLIVYAAIKFRSRGSDDGSEPPQIYGSNQVELAWTVIPILIVVVLFLAAARVIHAVEDARFPPGRDRGHRRRTPVLVGIPISSATASSRPTSCTFR